MNDPLESAVHALRVETSGKESRSGQYTRARVLATLRQKKRRRVLNLAFGIPLAALLIGSGAWASQNGLPHFIARISTTLFVRSTRAKPTSLRLPSTRTRETTKALENVSPGSAALVGELASAQPVTHLSATAVAAAIDSTTSVNPPAPVRAARDAAVTKTGDSRATELELATYERAHRAHFVERNPQASLPAWDGYLRAFPRGRFALEAQYNRAVCLVRLGQHEAARVALAPFASGIHAGYRQNEARALIQQLERGVP